MSRVALAALLLAACVRRVSIDDGPPSPTPISERLPASVRCDTGQGTVEVERWRASVEQLFRANGPAPSARLEDARLTCRTVVVDSRPVVSGSNRPMVLQSDVTELELQVEVSWTVTNARSCTLEGWLGRSMWRVVPTDVEGGDPLVATVRAAIVDALATAAVQRETRTPCPPPGL